MWLSPCHESSQWFYASCVALVGFSTIGGKHGTTSTSLNALHLPVISRHNYGIVFPSSGGHDND
ncbi:hypothetical protein ACTEVO_004906, partial [Escherichia coli]